MKKIIVLFLISIGFGISAMDKEIVQFLWSDGESEESSDYGFVENAIKKQEYKQKLKKAKKDVRKILRLSEAEPIIGLCADESKLAVIDTVKSELIVIDKAKYPALKTTFFPKTMTERPSFFVLSPDANFIAYIASPNSPDHRYFKDKSNHMLVIKNMQNVKHYFEMSDPYFLPDGIDFDKTGEFVYVHGKLYERGRYKLYQQPISLYEKKFFPMVKV